MTTPASPSERLIHSYGRRRGRRLRAGRASLLDTVLPDLSVVPPLQGEVLDPATLFDPACREVWLEVGFGGGEHLAEQAAAHRDVGLIGAEPYINGVGGLLQQIGDRALTNVRLWTDDIRLLLPSLKPASLARVFVLFPDPWPKLRHHKRRLIAPPFLDALARVMAPGAELRIATDDATYLTAILEHLTPRTDFHWTARRADDWRVRPADWPATRYEIKALAGRPHYLRFVRCPATEAENP